MGFHASFSHLLISSLPYSLIPSSPPFSSHLCWHPGVHPPFSMVSGRNKLQLGLITETSKQAKRWAASAAQSIVVLWLIGAEVANACKHPNLHKHRGHGGQSEQDSKEVGSVLNRGCLISTNEHYSFTVGVHFLWPQFLIASLKCICVQTSFHTFPYAHSMTVCSQLSNVHAVTYKHALRHIRLQFLSIRECSCYHSDFQLLNSIS